MRIQTTIGALLAITLVAGTAFAQDAKATEIIGRTRKALGGAKVEGLKTLTVQASGERNVGQMQMTSELELFVEMPDKYLKSETSRGMMNMTMASGFNGDRAIMPAGASAAGPGGAMVIRMGPGGMVPQDGPKPTPEQIEQMNKSSLRGARAEISRLMLGWFGAAHPALHAQYTYAGEAESPDGKAYVIDVKDADGFAARLFIDQNNSLPLMVTYQGRAPRVVTSGGPVARGSAGVSHPPAGGPPTTDDERRKMAQDVEQRIKREVADAPLVEFSLFFDDWREVDGVTFPHVMRRASGGETTEEWTIHKVKINPKIDAGKFTVENR